MNIYRRQRGISLAEILVAMVIGLFLLGGIVQVYTANKTAYAFTDAVSRVQENARFAMDTMLRDLRMAGFFGCTVFDPSDTDNITNNLDPGSPGYDVNLHDYTAQAVVEGTDGDGLNGSDSITIRGAKPSQYNVLPAYNVVTSDDIQVTYNEKLEIGDVIMVSNCRGSDIFEITGIDTSDATRTGIAHSTAGGAPGNINQGTCAHPTKLCLSQIYGTDASMFALQTVSYQIEPGASGEPSLWRYEFSNGEELIEGVEELQVLYGLDTSGDAFPNLYVTSNNVLDPFDIISVRLMLLMRSDTGAGVEGAQSYTFNGQTVNVNDNRLRQVFNTSIALRNRIGNKP
ncbi:MAG: hypothetical protein GY814_17085 [Gammaproteobacteria bacterium]|nr:hypothetical protein [Gammaproteobacteria bacterium]